MGMFKDMLSSQESLFKDTIPLDYDYIPKLIPYRESKQQYIAHALKPLFAQRNAKNLLIHGPPGVGKTVAVKHILQEMEEETDDVYPIFVNCWQKNSTYKIFLEMCDQLGFSFTQNKRTDELFSLIKSKVNKAAVVFVFDEVDKIEDHDFLYSILEEIYNSGIILITNFKNWINGLDVRIRSRLMLDTLEFKPYTQSETEGILKQRLGYAFVNGVWGKEAFEKVAQETYRLKDIRTGLYLLREACFIAENKSKKSIELEDVTEAVSKLDSYTIKDEGDLDSDLQLILDVVKTNGPKKIGDLYTIYQNKGGKAVYKTFTRKVKKLEMSSFIKVKKVTGAQGNTSILSYNDASKKLTDY
jgi:Cdc6-like AAA superfamily ATPase